jgi:hypothetical protein
MTLFRAGLGKVLPLPHINDRSLGLAKITEYVAVLPVVEADVDLSPWVNMATRPKPVTGAAETGGLWER